MTMVDTIERDGTSTHALSHKSHTAIINEAKSRGVKRIELHEYQEDSEWASIDESPVIG